METDLLQGMEGDTEGSGVVVPPAPLRLGLLGGFTLTSHRQVVRIPVGAQRLLAFLALGARPLLRVYVAGNLWPDSPERQAAGNLRSALWRVHRPRLPLVEASATHVRLAPGLSVDFEEAATLARRLLDSAATLDRLDVPALASDLLPDWYEDWVVLKREWFRQLRLHALERLCEVLTEAGRFGEAVEAGLAAVAAEPLRESAYRVLVKAHLAEGNVSEAIRSYRACRDLLRDELDVDPSPSLRELVPARSDRAP